VSLLIIHVIDLRHKLIYRQITTSTPAHKYPNRPQTLDFALNITGFHISTQEIIIKLAPLSALFVYNLIYKWGYKWQENDTQCFEVRWEAESQNFIRSDDKYFGALCNCTAWSCSHMERVGGVRRKRTHPMCSAIFLVTHSESESASDNGREQGWEIKSKRLFFWSITLARNVVFSTNHDFLNPKIASENRLFSTISSEIDYLVENRLKVDYLLVLIAKTRF
jgi:hypothetical protein